jgi:hypothetical protein
LPANEVYTTGNVQSVRKIALHEAIFLLHKSWHVLGCAENDGVQGRVTWSLSSGYHAALFAAKSLITFVGFPLVDHAGGLVLVKLFPVKPRTRIASDSIVSDELVDVIGLRHFQHREIWHFYQRVLTQLKVEEDWWPRAVADYLRRADVSMFAEERNEIHYRNCFWKFNDLHAPQIISGFAVPESTVAYRWDYPNDGRSVALGRLAFQVAFLLFRDICRRAGRLRTELQCLAKTATVDQHPLFSDYALDQ